MQHQSDRVAINYGYITVYCHMTSSNSSAVQQPCKSRIEEYWKLEWRRRYLWLGRGWSRSQEASSSITPTSWQLNSLTTAKQGY